MEQEVTYETKMQEFELKQQLKTAVSNWEEKTFNFIQVNVLNKYCDNALYEYTLYPTLEDTFDDWLYNCDVEIKIRDWIDEDTDVSIDSKLIDNWVSSVLNGKSYRNAFDDIFGKENWKELKKWGVEKYGDDISDYIYEQENYPMFNTCYEFRDTYYNSEEITEKCLSVGLGVIAGLEDFNNILFMKSAGHSFYSAYLIPLYLSFYPEEQEKYKSVNYNDL
jgi:hypothetical protein